METGEQALLAFVIACLIPVLILLTYCCFKRRIASWWNERLIREETAAAEDPVKHPKQGYDAIPHNPPIEEETS